MREKEGKRGKKKMDKREKEVGDVEGSTEMTEERVEEMTEERVEESTEQTEEVTDEAYEEDEICGEELECHSAKRARVCATFTDSQENAIVEFVKEHPELYNKERFHDRQKKEALWAEISAELKLRPLDVRRCFESQHT